MPLPHFHLRFLGSAGSRFAVLRQLRSSGGLWLSLGEESWIVDPGPGSLVGMHRHIPDFQGKIDGIILTHRHLDHSNDANIAAEAMTEGGRVTRGTIILTKDSIHSLEPVIFSYLHRNAEKVIFWEEGQSIPFENGGIFQGVKLVHHGVDCFGFRARHPQTVEWGLISDTRALPKLFQAFASCRVLILNVTLLETREHLDHLSLEQAYDIIGQIKPELAIITHMGVRILENNPDKIIHAKKFSETTIIPAKDGMVVDLQKAVVVR